MKHKIFIVLLLALIGSFSPPDLSAQAILTYSHGDTLSARDTVILYPISAAKFKSKNWNYSVHVRADSLSGANAGTVYLQFSNDGTLWWNHPTSITIDGPAASFDEYGWDGILYAQRMRIYAITPDATARTVRMRTAVILRP
jgi:hypothetical protein